MTEADFMRYAIELSSRKMQEIGAAPFAAVIVKDGRIVGEGCNTVLLDHDPTLHGEVAAIRDACRRLGTFDLSGLRHLHELRALRDVRRRHLVGPHRPRLLRQCAGRHGTHDADRRVDPRRRPVRSANASVPAQQLMAAEAYAVIKQWVDSGQSEPP